VLIVTSIIADEETAVQAVHLGAQDYLIKGLVDTGALTRSLRYAFERARAEEALTQGLRRLAGGVAHDFNNLLTVILGHSESLLLRGDPGGDPVSTPRLGQIELAAERAARLTRQLLLFARRGVVQPVIVDLDLLTQAVSQLLRGMIGENVDLVVQCAPGLWRVKADASHIEQLIVNLALNARDAMPGGGRLTIATANAQIDTSRGRELGVAPGPYVELTVTDTGERMSDEMKAHVFEPFYATRDAERGTGLGLATCRIIVQESGGRILCSGEQGKGTTFTVFLPRFGGQSAAPERAEDASAIGGTGTLLVVEAEPLVRAFAVRALREMGYHVLEASYGIDALKVSEESAGRIDLVITDWFLPKMGGKTLVEQLRVGRPELRALYTSGYTDEERPRLGTSLDEACFLPKPFTGSALAKRVREMLGR
jgi:signal transduction histidine kinase/CheY-like chemotaxis protein